MDKIPEHIIVSFLALILIFSAPNISAGAGNLYSPLGTNLGGFTLFPRFESQNVYDTNIFRSNEFKRDDFIFHLRPSVDVQSNWSRHALDLSVSSDIAYHATYETEDWQDYFIDLSGRLDVVRDSFATAKFYQGRLHEDRGTPENFSTGISPVVYFKLGGLFGYQHRINRVVLDLSNETFQLNYNNSISALNGAVIQNDRRDRLSNTSIFRAGYDIHPGFQTFIRGRYQFINYDSENDIFGVSRNSTGYQIVAGIALDLTGKLVGDAYLGYLNKSYDNPIFQGLNDITGGFSFTWYATGLTTVSANLDRVPIETTQGLSSGALDTRFSFSVNHELLRNVLLNVKAGYANVAYTGSSGTGLPERTDNYYLVDLNAKYLLNRNFYILGGYSYNNRGSNISLVDYDVNRVTLTFGMQM